MVSWCASSGFFILRERNTRLAILSIELVILKSRVQIIIRFPAETSTMILRIKRQALAYLIFTIGFWSVPTIMSNRAFKSWLALLIGSSKLCTFIGPGPNFALLTEHLCVTISMRIAKVCCLEANTKAVYTCLKNAFPGSCACSTIVQIIHVILYLATICISSFMIQPWVFYSFADFETLATPMLLVFIDPGPFISL